MFSYQDCGQGRYKVVGRYICTITIPTRTDCQVHTVTSSGTHPFSESSSIDVCAKDDDNINIIINTEKYFFILKMPITRTLLNNRLL